MTMPIAYEPQHGYKYQLLSWYGSERQWEHLDYAKDKEEKGYLMGEYRASFGPEYRFKAILLPKKYWVETDINS